MPGVNPVEESLAKPGAIDVLHKNPLYQDGKNAETASVADSAAVFYSDVNLSRTPSWKIYIFNTSPVEYERQRPPNHPRIKLAPCPPGQPWKLVARIPDIIQEKYISADTGQIGYHGLRGELFATDIINPANHTGQMWTDRSDDPSSWLFSSEDLSVRGVFWSYNETPTADELKKSRTRKEAFYRRLITEADKFAVKPETTDQIGPEHHLAADYFRMTRSWHSMSEAPELCPNCGEDVKPGVAFHMASFGMCVLSWKGAVAAGVKKREDVPEEHRWWKEKAS